MIRGAGMIAVLAGLAGALGGCERSGPASSTTQVATTSPAPGTPAPGTPAPGMSVPPAPGPPRSALSPPSPASDELPEDDAPPAGPALTAAELRLPAPDRWGKRRVRRDTAVLLFASRQLDDEPATGRVFQPLVCSIAGVRATGAACGEAMPARATIRTARGELTVARSTQPFHDANGDHDYAAPYGPACCMYNTCLGNTVPYHAARGARLAADPGILLAVWPADADISLEVAPAAITPGAADGLPIAASRRIDQAFTRGDRRYVALHGRTGGAVQWNLGAGWITGDATMGSHGSTLLATTDVDHDGHLELVSLQRWANDYGLDVFGDAAAPLYSFSCGNI